jgi:hypothetical protein
MLTVPCRSPCHSSVIVEGAPLAVPTVSALLDIFSSGLRALIGLGWLFRLKCCCCSCCCIVERLLTA